MLCVTDIYSKHARVVPLKNKKGITITNAFQTVLDESNRKPNEIWVDEGSEFYKRLTKLWLQNNGIEIYSTHNEGKSAVAETFIATLNNKISKHITALLNNMCIDNLDDILDRYNNKYYGTFKMKPTDVKSSTYIDFGVEKK